MLASEQLDIVSVCTPNALHADMAIRAMEYGAHVHCEKPMAMNAADARRMVKARDETGRILMIGFQRRFGADARYLKQFIDSGEMGSVYHVNAKWVRRRGIPGFGGWFTTREKSGGGALIDIGVHVLDLALWFMGFPAPINVASNVGARFGNRGLGASSSSHWRATPSLTFDVDDYAFAHISFENQASITLETSWAGHIKEDALELEIWGEDAGARLWPLEIFTTKDGEPADFIPSLGESRQHNESVDHFINVVQGREELLCTPEEGLAGIELIEQIYRGAGIPPVANG